MTIEIKTGIVLEWDNRNTYISLDSTGIEMKLIILIAQGYTATFAPLGPGESGVARVVLVKEE